MLRPIPKTLTQVKFLCKMVWFVGASAILSGPRALQGNYLWDQKSRVTESSKQCMGMLCFLAANYDKFGKRHTEMEPFAYYTPSFALSLCFTALMQGETFSNVYLSFLTMFVRNTSDGEEPFQHWKASQFWNLIINNGSEVEDQSLRDSGVVQYLSTSQLYMHYLVTHSSLLMYVMQGAELDLCIEWLGKV